jgi:hypothetical protein
MMDYPNLEQVQAGSAEQIVRWNRHLPSAINDEQLEILSVILDRLKKLTPDERVRASKNVGWDDAT